MFVLKHNCLLMLLVGISIEASLAPQEKAPTPPTSSTISTPPPTAPTAPTTAQQTTAPIPPTTVSNTTPPPQTPSTSTVATITVTPTDSSNPPKDADMPSLTAGLSDLPDAKNLMQNAATSNIAGMQQQTKIGTPAQAVTVPAPDTSTTLPKTDPAALIAAGKQIQNAAAQVGAEQEAQKTAAMQKQNDTFAYNLSGLQAAGIDISKNGCGITTMLDLGFGPALRLSLQMNSTGIMGKAIIPEIDIGSFFKITAAPDAPAHPTTKPTSNAEKGASVELRVDDQVQEFTISGGLDFLGNTGEIYAHLGSSSLQLMIHTSLFDAFKTTFYAEIKPNDGDFMLAGAIQEDFISFIEHSATAVLTQLGKGIVSGAHIAEKGVSEARNKVAAFKHQIADLQKRYDDANARYKAHLNGAQKQLEIATAGVQTAIKDITSTLKQILVAREKVLSAKKALVSAESQVNKLNSEVTHAKNSISRLKRSMKWYEFWKLAEIAYWAARLAAVQAARLIALGALKAIETALQPIAAAFSATYAAAWVASHAALLAAYAQLEAAMAASNPMTIDEFAEVLATSAALNGAKLSYYSAQGTLLAAYAATQAAAAAATTAITITKDAIALALTIAGGVFRIVGGGFLTSYSDIKKGDLTLYLLAYVFGVKKHIKIILDMTNPQKTIASIGSMIGQLLDPSSNGNGGDPFSDISLARKQFGSQMAELDTKRTAVVQAQAQVSEQQTAREQALTQLKADQDARLAAVKAQYPFTADDIRKMGDADYLPQNKPVSIVDENNPTTYAVKNMQNTYRWLQKWAIPTTGGSVIFNVIGTEEIQIGFHHTIDAKAQKTNKDFEVILGAAHNTANTIRDAQNNILFVSGDPAGRIPAVAHDGSNAYWISYAGGYIAVGKGTTPGINMLFDYQFTTPPPDIQFFSFSSQTNQLGFSTIHTGPAFTKTFGSQYSSYDASDMYLSFFKLPSTNSGTITFTAKAASNLAIGFSDTNEYRSGRYVTVLGADGNSQSYMATTSPNGQTYSFQTSTQDSAALLPRDNGTTYYPYWITFNNGHCVCGTGTDATKNILMEMMVNPNTLGASVAPPPAPTTETVGKGTNAKGAVAPKAAPSSAAPAKASTPCPVQYVGFSSWDNMVEIRNITIGPAVPVPAGTCFSAMNKQFTSSWQEAWKLPEPSSGIITWEGKASSDMALGFTTADGIESSTAPILATFGAQGNTVTTITAGTTTLTQTIDENATIYSATDYTPYWCSMENGYLMLGTGTTPGQNVVLEGDTGNTKLTNFAFTTGTGALNVRKITVLPAKTALTHGTQYTAQPGATPLYRTEWTLPDTGGFVLAEVCAGQGYTYALKGADTEYHLTLGGTDGKTLTLTDAKGAVLATKTNATSLIIDASNFYPYWFSYDTKSGIIAAGNGIKPGQNTLISHAIPDTPALTKFSFGANAQTAYFKNIGSFSTGTATPESYLACLKHSSYVVSSPGSQPQYLWDQAWALDKENYGSLLFKVRTAQTACVGIGSPDTGAVYELSINAHTIALLYKGAVVAQSSDHAVLPNTSTDFNAYWLSCDNGHIVVGTGSTLQTNGFLEWANPHPTEKLTHFSFSSEQGQSSFGGITSQPGIKIPLYQRYSSCRQQGAWTAIPQWQLPQPEQGVITFAARTDGDILVELGTKTKADYTITIGTSCTISRFGLPVVSAQNSVPPNPKDYTPYWVLFDKGYLAVGNGVSPSNESLILEFQDLPIQDIVQAFSLSSTTSQVTYATIGIQPSTIGTLTHNAAAVASGLKRTYVFDDRWPLPKPGTGSLVFTAQGPGPYYIGLDAHEGNRTTPLIELIIGDSDNRSSELCTNGVPVATTTDSNAMTHFDNSPVTFWLVVDQNRCTAGVGDTPGKKPFLDWRSPTPIAPQYIAFSSATNVVHYSGIAVSPAVTPEAISAFSIPRGQATYLFKADWELPQANNGGIQLSAAGKDGISLGLHTGMSGTPYYEAIVGTKQTVLKANGTVVASTTNPAALITSEFVPQSYWFTYNQGVLCFGVDDVPGNNMLLAWTDEQALRKPVGITFCAPGTQGEMVTVTSISPIPGLKKVSARTVYMATPQQGAFTYWNPQWRIKAGQTITATVSTLKGDLYVGFNNVASSPPRYALTIGGWQNSTNAVIQGTNTLAKANYSFPAAPTAIWVTYQNNALSFGIGDPKSKPLYEWFNSTPDPDDIAYFSLSAGATPVLYENITVVDGQPAHRPQPAILPTQNIAIATAPSSAPTTQKNSLPEADYAPVTDPSSPLYMPPAVAALMQNPDAQPGTVPPSASQSTPPSSTSGTVTPPQTIATLPVQSSQDFLKSLNPAEFTDVLDSSTAPTTPTPQAPSSSTQPSATTPAPSATTPAPPAATPAAAAA